MELCDLEGQWPVAFLVQQRGCY